MILDTTTRSARIVLGEAVTTTAPTVCAFWADQVSGTGGFLPGDTNTTTTGTTPVTIVAAPGPNAQRAVTEIRAYNSDTVNHSFTLQLDDNGTIYPIETVTVGPGGTYSYVGGQLSSTNAVAALLLEGGTTSEKISQLVAGASLDGTELFVAVQTGADVQTTGNDLGFLILTSSFTTNPLNAAPASGANGTGAAIFGGDGDGAGNGGTALLGGGDGGASNAVGGPAVIQGGAGSGTAVGGSIFMLPGSSTGTGANGNVTIDLTNGGNPNPVGDLVLTGLSFTDPAVTDALWNDNGAVVISGSPVNTVASVASGAAVSLSTTVAMDVTTISVANAGKYWLSGVVYFTGASTTTITALAASVGTAANTLNTTVGAFGTQYLAGAAFSAIGQDISVVAFGVVVTATAAETFHLCASATFGVSTLSAYGEIAAVPIL